VSMRPCVRAEMVRSNEFSAHLTVCYEDQEVGAVVMGSSSYCVVCSLENPYKMADLPRPSVCSLQEWNTSEATRGTDVATSS
jgi:hypothetical protein